MTAIVRTNARKERAGLERLLVLESALRDVANASAQSLVDLQSKLDQVRVHVQALHSLGVLMGFEVQGVVWGFQGCGLGSFEGLGFGVF